MTDSDETSETPLGTPLQRLILGAKEGKRGRLSYRELERRSGVDAEGRPALSHTALLRLAKDPLRRHPSDDHVIALARALDVAEHVVRDAIVASLPGYLDPATRHTRASRLAERIDRLPAARQGEILAAAELLVSAAEALERAEMVREHGNADDIALDVGSDVAQIHEAMMKLSPSRRREFARILELEADDDDGDAQPAANGRRS